MAGDLKGRWKKYLQELAKKIHPDFFSSWPELAKKNETALGQINSFVDAMVQLSEPDASAGGGRKLAASLGEKLSLELYLRLQAGAGLQQVTLEFPFPLGNLHIIETTDPTPSALRVLQKHRGELQRFAERTICSILQQSGVPVAPEDVPPPAPALGDLDGGEQDQQDGGPTGVAASFAEISRRLRDRSKEDHEHLISIIAEEVICWKRARSLEERDRMHQMMMQIPREKRQAWRLYDARRMMVSPLLPLAQAQVAVVRFIQQIPYLEYAEWADIPVILTLPEAELMNLSPPSDNQPADTPLTSSSSNAQSMDTLVENKHEEEEEVEGGPLAGFIVLPCDFTVDSARRYLDAFLPRIRRAHDRRHRRCQLALEAALELARHLRCRVSFTLSAREALPCLSVLLDLTPQLAAFRFSHLSLVVVDASDPRLLGQELRYSLPERLLFLSCRFRYISAVPLLQSMKTRLPDIFDPLFNERRSKAVRTICRHPLFHDVFFDPSLDGRPLQQLSAVASLLPLGLFTTETELKPRSFLMVVHNLPTIPNGGYHLSRKEAHLWVPWNVDIPTLKAVLKNLFATPHPLIQKATGQQKKKERPNYLILDRKPEKEEKRV